MRARSLLLVAPGRVEFVDDDLPAAGAGELLVETVAGSVSVGSELPRYRGDERRLEPPRYPAMTGYENVATVRATGPGVAGFAAGDRVLAF